MARSAHVGSRIAQRIIQVCIFVGIVWIFGHDPLYAQEAVVKNTPTDWLASFGLDDQCFVVTESDHFSLATNVDHSGADLWLEQLESTYQTVERFSTSLKLPFVTPPNKLHVIVFASADDLQQFADRTNIAIQQSNGLYIVESNVSVFVDAASHPLLRRASDQIKDLRAELVQLGDETTDPKYQKWRGRIRIKIIHLQQRRDRLTQRFNRVVLRHEAAHQIFYNVGIHQDKHFEPLWLREGMACLFETTPNKGVDIPINRSRYYDLPWLRGLRSADSTHEITAYEAKLRAAAKSCRDLTIALLSDDEFLSAIHDDAAQRYAQAWALVYYLSKRFPEAFAKYVQHADTTMSLDQNTPNHRLRAFEMLFGKMDEEFCSNWLKYMAAKRLDRNPASR